jgi:hypothetical protein
MLSSVNTEFPPVQVDSGASWMPVDKFLDKPIEPKKLVAEVEQMLQAGPEK